MSKLFRPSCGSEGMDFMDRFCDRCERDAAFQRDPFNNDGCSIAAATMALQVDEEGYPKEWIYGDDGEPTCTAFVAISEGRS